MHMDFLNSIIINLIEQDAHEAAYGMAGTVGQVLLWLTVLWYIWRRRLNPLKAIPVTYICSWFILNWNGLLLAILSGFTDVARSNMAVAFVYLFPVAWLLAKLFRMPWQTVSEMATFGILAFHVIGRSGCIFTGCCYGYPCDWGLYSDITKGYVFPIVIVESLMTLGILIFLLIRARGKSYVPDGKTLPWMLVLYGAGRFITEFFHDNEKIWLGCSDIAFHALFMCAVGIILLIVIHKKNEKAKTAESL